MKKKIGKLFLSLIIEILKAAGAGLKYFGSRFAIIRIGILFHPSELTDIIYISFGNSP